MVVVSGIIVAGCYIKSDPCLYKPYPLPSPIPSAQAKLLLQIAARNRANVLQGHHTENENNKNMNETSDTLTII